MKLQGIGLVCTGAVTRSFLARMPAVLARLGPVKASSFRVGRQISHSLRAGQAASHYSALETCPMVWFSVLDSSLDRALRDFAAQTPIHKTMVVLCDSVRESGACPRASSSVVRVEGRSRGRTSRARHVARCCSGKRRVFRRSSAEPGAAPDPAG